MISNFCFGGYGPPRAQKPDRSIFYKNLCAPVASVFVLCIRSYTCPRASTGSIREALYAGCKLAKTETTNTMADTQASSEKLIVGDNKRLSCRPKAYRIL